MLTLYETTLRYIPAGSVANKKITEIYLIDACSFSDAEGHITEKIIPYTHAGLDVLAIKRTNYAEAVVAPTDPDDDRDALKWFRAKLHFITLDERTLKEKKSASYFIVQATGIEDAHRRVIDFMKDSITNYEIATLDEIKVVDVFLDNLLSSKSGATDNG